MAALVAEHDPAGTVSPSYTVKPGAPVEPLDTSTKVRIRPPQEASERPQDAPGSVEERPVEAHGQSPFPCRVRPKDLLGVVVQDDRHALGDCSLQVALKLVPVHLWFRISEEMVMLRSRPFEGNARGPEIDQNRNDLEIVTQARGLSILESPICSGVSIFGHLLPVSRTACRVVAAWTATHRTSATLD